MPSTKQALYLSGPKKDNTVSSPRFHTVVLRSGRLQVAVNCRTQRFNLKKKRKKNPNDENKLVDTQVHIFQYLANSKTV